MAKLVFQKVGARQVAAGALLGAVAALLEIIPGPPFDIPFPLYQRISWDFTGIPVVTSILFYGPVSGLLTTFIGSSIIFFRGNVFGGVFKLLAELATLLGFILVKRSVFLKSIVAIALRVGVMTVANYLLLQLFYGMTELVVVALLFPVAVFNLSQALINIVPAYLIWRRMSKSPFRT